MFPPYYLYLWLPAVFSGGAAFNLLLIRYLAARSASRSWVLAIISGAATHVVALLAANAIARLAFAVPDEHREEVMYFVGPAVTMFISLPVAIVALFLPMRVKPF